LFFQFRRPHYQSLPSSKK